MNLGDESHKKRSRTDSGCGAVITCSLAERPLVDTRDSMLETLTIRCGVNEECLLEDSVRHVVGARQTAFGYTRSLL